MTVREDSNLDFPFVLKRGAVTVGHMKMAKWPDEAMGEADVTGHDSGGNEENMPNGLISRGSFVGTAIFDATSYSTVRGDFEAGTVTTWTLSDGVDSTTGSAWVKTLKRSKEADASNPEAIKWEFELRRTGSWSWTPS